MLGFLFGFNARIGRLHFFCSTLVVTIMMVAVHAAAIAYTFQTTPKGTMPSPTAGPIFAAAIFYAWLTITLQSMRFRDIGWDPVCVMPAWIAVVIVDGLVATKFPAMSLGHERGTAFGALVNLSLILALLFCPSGADDSPAPTLDERFRTPDPPPPRPVAEAPAAPQISRPANGGFGRRGL
ncbi:hypothetical protein CQ14_11685 [Bradyrhizobium lablabi]|uniref:DUF805 domain-containing protein n=1 Tax=Bradyrhizobium lablabi TaxID=722472 RepID=A0A0R3MS97_9BRAD|nr:DUF805 domain-containing protein [Bradyrhizobium lablabi]KRR20653.1 hypothetical protein CQ14_11685 [Bradyrhizobium lablabi]